MEWVPWNFWILHSVSVSVYEKQRFCTHSISFVKPGCQTGHAYSSSLQSELLCIKHHSVTNWVILICLIVISWRTSMGLSNLLINLPMVIIFWTKSSPTDQIVLLLQLAEVS